MKVWKDKNGQWLTAKEFMARWKQGIQEVTQYQQIKAQINFTYMVLIGIFCGLIMTSLNFKELWWLTIILIASAGNTGVGLVALIQKRNMFYKLEELNKEYAFKEVALPNGL